ncbi:MAG: isoprenylcysteine carboxylmethyltransferase family protein [Sphingomonas sp.]|jgi:protein-S-isoprenylcysteine O-methyltransferase Ste14
MPVGKAGLIVFAVGFLAFLLAIGAAKLRGRRHPRDADNRRDMRSVLWIAAQGAGMAFLGIGGVRVELEPFSLRALTDAAIVGSLMGGAVGLFHWASATMGRNWALIARTRDDGSLITDGPFAWVRNPIYVALALVMVAMGVAFGHLAGLVVALPVFCIATWLRVRSEEEVLRASFGPAYDEYAAKVKRFIPGLF